MKKVGDRERVQRRHVSRHHARPRRTVMNLNRAHALEDLALVLVRVMAENQAVTKPETRFASLSIPHR